MIWSRAFSQPKKKVLNFFSIPFNCKINITYPCYTSLSFIVCHYMTRPSQIQSLKWASLKDILLGLSFINMLRFGSSVFHHSYLVRHRDQLLGTKNKPFFFYDITSCNWKWTRSEHMCARSLATFLMTLVLHTNRDS